MFLPAVVGGSPAQDLVNGVLGLGSFDTRNTDTPGGRLVVHLFAGWDAAYRDSLATGVARAFDGVNAFFGAKTEDPYTVILTPKSADGLDLAVAANGGGQAMEMQPATPARWMLLASRMADRYVRFPPHGIVFERREDLWLAQALAWYAGFEGAVASGGLADPDVFLRDAYLTYNELALTLFQAHPYSPTQLDQIDGGTGTAELRRSMAIVLADQLDRTLREASGGAVSIERAARALHENGRIEEAVKDLEYATGVEMAGFMDTFVDVARPAEIPYLGDGSYDDQLARFERHPRSRSDIVDTLTLVVTSGAQGFLETCGCVVSQSGGVARRATVIEQVRRTRGKVMVVDAGDFLPDPRDVPEMDDLTAGEVRTYLTTLRTMGYDVVVVGRNELYYGVPFFEAMTRGLGLPALSATVRTGGGLMAAPTWTGGLGPRVGVVGLYRPRHRLIRTVIDDRMAGLSFNNPVHAARDAVDDLSGEADLVVAMGQLRWPEVEDLATQVPEIDVILTPGSHSGSVRLSKGELVEIRGLPEGFIGRTLVLSPNGGQYGVSRVDLLLDAQGEVVDFDELYVNLNEWVPDELTVRGQLDAFYRTVAQTAALRDGQARPLFEHDPVFDERSFVGTEACLPCHDAQGRQWQYTRHARAYKTLLDAHRHYYPKCVTCHVAGLGRETGYRVGDGESDMANVTCEVCHGPGSAHVESPSPATIRRSPKESLCVTCHHGQHDDAWNYERKLALVTH